VAQVAIALLLFWSLQSWLESLWYPFFSVTDFLATAIAIWGVPYHSWGWRNSTIGVRVLWLSAGLNFFYAVVLLATAKAMSHLVYGVGPVKAIGRLRQHQRDSNV
jgi:hypothetical protein